MITDAGILTRLFKAGLNSLRPLTRLILAMKIIFKKIPFTLAVSISICFLMFSALAQTAAPKPANTDAKAEQIVARALSTLGGASYMNVKTVVGRGYFTPFKNGVSGDPIAFTDYIAYPDRERTEFRSRVGRVIQTNTGATGWLFDGAAKTLKSVTPDMVEDFRISIRTSVENLLRGYWRSEGAQLSYVGRREAGVGRRNETVKLTYPDGFTVEFEIGARDNLPAKAIYTKKNNEGEETIEEDRLAQYIKIGDITVPFVIDHFSANQQTSRVNYEAVEFNRPLPESLFARPANVKAVR